MTYFIPRSRHYIRRDDLRAHACVEHAKPLFRAALDRPKGPATRNDFVNDIVNDARADAMFATLKAIVDDEKSTISLRVAWPLIRPLVTPASEKEGSPRSAIVVYAERCQLPVFDLFFRTMSEKHPKQTKRLGKKLLSRRRHLSLACAVIEKTHKSDISPQRQHPIQTRCQTTQSEK